MNEIRLGYIIYSKFNYYVLYIVYETEQFVVTHADCLNWDSCIPRQLGYKFCGHKVHFSL
jgi:hypothetical protein